ncbi:MAG TPA: acylphosphatase [Candidatus Acidoferrum sp.]|nr:acylphosphatase [Candidatus Acidoferrum sp.]
MNEEKQTRRYFVSGIVQGVGYRFFVRDVAERLKISGYTRNLFDGRVEVLASGSPAQHAALRVALERGPRFSSVSVVHEEVAPRDREYEHGFVIEPNG